MDQGALKYQTGQEKDQLRAKRNKKLWMSKLPQNAALTAEEQELIKTALEARDEWIETSRNFDYVHEEMLVDYYTYRMKASEVRYDYFIKLVKEKGLSRYI
ncbi:MAG: DUF2508 family protein [Clostridiaceae bacterium]